MKYVSKQASKQTSKQASKQVSKLFVFSWRMSKWLRKRGYGNHHISLQFQEKKWCRSLLLKEWPRVMRTSCKWHVETDENEYLNQNASLNEQLLFVSDFRDRKEEIPTSPKLVRHATEKTFDSQAVTESSETSVDSQKVTRGFPPQPSESAIHGREVHVAKQKQTQKEVCTNVVLQCSFHTVQWNAMCIAVFLKLFESSPEHIYYRVWKGYNKHAFSLCLKKLWANGIT